MSKFDPQSPRMPPMEAPQSAPRETKQKLEPSSATIYGRNLVYYWQTQILSSAASAPSNGVYEYVAVTWDSELEKHSVVPLGTFKYGYEARLSEAASKLPPCSIMVRAGYELELTEKALFQGDEGTPTSRFGAPLQHKIVLMNGQCKNSKTAFGLRNMVIDTGAVNVHLFESIDLELLGGQIIHFVPGITSTGATFLSLYFDAYLTRVKSILDPAAENDPNLIVQMACPIDYITLHKLANHVQNKDLMQIKGGPLYCDPSNTQLFSLLQDWLASNNCTDQNMDPVLSSSIQAAGVLTNSRASKLWKSDGLLGMEYLSQVAIQYNPKVDYEMKLKP